MRLLIVEDDDALREILLHRFTREGYGTDACGDGIEGLEFALAGPYDGVILDVMLPGMDGISILTTLRARGFTGGVLLLTARDAIEDRVKGLDAGADDYVVKPFSLDELSARLRALLRKHTPGRSALLRVGELEMDTVAHIARRGGKHIPLTAKEYALLEYMMRNSGLILTPGQIFDHVWNYDAALETNLVPVYIGYLRRKIDRNAKTKYIHTVRGMGYVLREEESCED